MSTAVNWSNSITRRSVTPLGAKSGPRYGLVDVAEQVGDVVLVSGVVVVDVGSVDVPLGVVVVVVGSAGVGVQAGVVVVVTVGGG
jgi:hypothetical protein